MIKVIETQLSDKITVWGYGDVTHTPRLHEIELEEREGWSIGQKVRVTIESMPTSGERPT